MMKQLGKIWSNLSKEERKSYEDVAKKDKDRYDKEMKILTGNGIMFQKIETKNIIKSINMHIIFVIFKLIPCQTYDKSVNQLWNW